MLYIVINCIFVKKMIRKILIFSLGLFMSCKKNYTCECKGYDATYYGSKQTYFKPYKKNYIIKTTSSRIESKCTSDTKIVDYYTHYSINREECLIK